METLHFTEFVAGRRFDFGPVILSEEEIVEFALRNDPQPIHTDKGYAEQSLFGGLIASGFHVFVAIHKTFWVPMVRANFLCGLSIDHWRFYRPVYAGMKLLASAEIVEIQPDAERGRAVVSWRYNFTTETREPVQTVDFTVLHRMGL
ncbi:MAG: hypothetical protein HY760_03015 [Nitrospirae bacterium]|nr:hypothetical protein [Nitrospirota bacterium]